MSTARHATVEPDDTEPVEETKSAPERYRADLRRRSSRFSWWTRWPAGQTYEVDVVTTHEIRPVMRRIDDNVTYGETEYHESQLDRPRVCFSLRWSEWKGRRLVAAALKRDVREGQPWAEVQ